MTAIRDLELTSPRIRRLNCGRKPLQTVLRCAPLRSADERAPKSNPERSAENSAATNAEDSAATNAETDAAYTGSRAAGSDATRSFTL